MNDFETWWYHEGSGPRLPGEDGEEHCKRMCEIAWSNGAFKSHQEVARLLEAAKTIMENLDGMEGEVTAGYHESIIAPLRDAIAKATGAA